MALDSVSTHLTPRQKKCTYAIICLLSLLGGIEYAVILPTLYLHLQHTYHAPTYFLGMVLSAFSFSGLFASPIMGRIYDQTRKAKLLISFTNLFEIIGSLMYWMGINEWFLLASRLVAGLGNGFFSIVLAEVTHGSTSKDRTSIVSAVMAARQFGLLLGPGFNLFLRETNFYIGPFIVNLYSSPGIFMALLWFIAQWLHMFLYYPLTKPVKSTSNNVNINHPHQTSDSDRSAVSSDSSDTHVTVSSLEDDGGVVSDSDNTAFSTKQALKELVYDEYMAIFLLTFVALFNQTGVETLATPMCNLYLGWSELEISLMFCAAGVIILVSFLLVHFCSKRFNDRPLIIFGLICQISSIAWLFWLPSMQKESIDHLRNAVILMAGLVVNVSGLPFLFVCHISLFSKLLHKNIQGTGHGVRRAIGGIAAILGPLWCGSLLLEPNIMIIVMLGLNVGSMTLMLLSYSRLKPVDVTNNPSNVEEPNEKTQLINS